MANKCSLCVSIEAMAADPTPVTEEGLFVSGFAMGVVMQRVAERTKIQVTTALCPKHLQDVRYLANATAKAHPALIPFLGFGLEVVQGGKDE